MTANQIINTIILTGYIFPVIILCLMYKKIREACERLEVESTFKLPFGFDRIAVELMIILIIFFPILNLWFAIRGIKFSITRKPE